MLFDLVSRRIARGLPLAVVALGAGVGGAVAAGTHPAVATAALSAVTATLTCATTIACVSGVNTGAGPGVSGTSAHGVGITATGGTSGLTAVGTTGYGVSGTNATAAHAAVFGNSTATNGTGVYGSAVGISGYGVRGGSIAATGVAGSSTTNVGVRGASSSSDGVLGSSVTSYGVSGQTQRGPAGVIGTMQHNVGGAGVYGLNLAPVVSGSTGHAIGVAGSSNGGYGVYGSSVNSTGIGVLGTDQTGIGVQGSTDLGTAVYSYAEHGFGLVAQAQNAGVGVSVTAVTGDGIDSVTAGGLALNAKNSNGTGALITGVQNGLVAQTTGNGALPIQALNNAQTDVFHVDDGGNVIITGQLFSGSGASGGHLVKTFSPKAALPTVEDTGTAQLVGGLAAVALEPTFASTIDGTTAYRVFLTPNGDTRGLYVQSKTLRGFIVREAQGGRSTVSFDYRIVATPLGESGRRLSAYTPRVVPRSVLRQPPASEANATLVASPPAAP